MNIITQFLGNTAVNSLLTLIGIIVGIAGLRANPPQFIKRLRRRSAKSSVQAKPKSEIWEQDTLKLPIYATNQATPFHFKKGDASIIAFSILPAISVYIAVNSVPATRALDWLVKSIVVSFVSVLYILICFVEILIHRQKMLLFKFYQWMVFPFKVFLVILGSGGIIVVMGGIIGLIQTIFPFLGNFNFRTFPASFLQGIVYAVSALIVILFWLIAFICFIGLFESYTSCMDNIWRDK